MIKKIVCFVEIKYFFVLAASVVSLSGCGIHSTESVDPGNYHRAADYASDVVSRSGCIGKVDGLFFSSGDIYVNSDGLNYSSRGAGLHCTESSFIEAMSRYCKSKSGTFSDNDNWCSVGDTPIFRAGEFTTIERAPSQSNDEWLQSSRRQGYESKRDQKLKEAYRQHKAEMEKERIVKEMNVKVNAEVGDLICREDYEAKPYQYPGTAYYKAYVEKKENNKFQIRLIWHGGDGFVVNDITNINNVVWITPKGWHHCN